MKVDDIKSVAVIGAGLMGHGIALEFACAGYKVHIHGRSEEKLQQAIHNIRNSLQMLTKIGFITNVPPELSLANISSSIILKDVVEDADLVIETIAEDLRLKQNIFKELDTICPERTILASNTSSYMPSKLSSVTQRPDKVLVTHFFNPPYLLPLVEVVRSEKTSDETVSTVNDLLIKVGKSPITVKKEVPGFVAIRLQAALFREALSIVQKGIASPHDVDTVIKKGFGRRYAVAGIFELSDIAGLDVGLAIISQLSSDLESSSELAHNVLKEKVEHGEFGVKAGKGFYEWTPESVDNLKQKIAQALSNIIQWT